MVIRRATGADLAAIVALLADDTLGAQRESPQDPLPREYVTAFAAIEADPSNELIVAEIDGEVIGVLQITYIPYLLQRGSRRALVEGVRVSSKRRGQGVGEQLFRWVIARAEERGCALLQLTTDKRRDAAKRFYERIGFVATHEGMKLVLPAKA